MVLALVGPEGSNSSAYGARTLSAISFQQSASRPSWEVLNPVLTARAATTKMTSM
jgi:hypothetical protein